jgi:hypothetical protein
MRDRYSTILFCWPPFTTRNRIDSGKTPIKTIARTTGIEPPTRNTDCHPNCLMTAAATQPAHAEPSENPQTIVITAEFLDRSGMYSDVRAMALGITPPIPNPVNTRNAVSCATEVAVAVSSDPTPEGQDARDQQGLRPDAVGERAEDERADHHAQGPARNHGPSATRAMWSSARSAGATNPIT